MYTDREYHEFDIDIESLPFNGGNWLTRDMFLRVVSYSRRSTLFTLLFVCRTWATIVNRILLHDTDFSVFLAVSSSFVVRHHTIYGAIPNDDDWYRFQNTHARHIRCLADRAYSSLALDPGPFLFTGVFACPAHIFCGLHTLRVDIEHLRPPLLCASIVNLCFSIRRGVSANVTPFYHPELASISLILRSAAFSIPGLRTLRIDGDESLEEFVDDIAIFCEGLLNLVSIEISPHAMSRRLLFVLSRLPCLQTLRILETGQDGAVRPRRDVAVLTPPALELDDGSFPRVHEMALSAWSPSVTTSFVVQPGIASLNLTTLWFRYSSVYPIVAEEVRYLLYAFGLACPRLQALTMRFASYGWDITQDHIMEPFTLHHLRLFYTMPSLIHFAFDHCFPTYFTAEDLEEIASNCWRFKSLFLNPYPTCHTRDYLSHLPPVTALEPFALLCPGLEKLGVLVDATISPGRRWPAKFLSLEELHVGWSLIPGCAGFGAIDPRWHTIAEYFSRLFPDGAKIKTIHNGRMEDDSSSMVLAPMRARARVLTDFDAVSRHRSLTWLVVWAMAMSLRQFRRWESEGVRDGIVR